MILNYVLSVSLFYLECVDYRRITNADRKVTYRKFSVQCDKTIDTAWYRFEGAAGTRMPTSCPPLYKCNTNAPGWLKGGHLAWKMVRLLEKRVFTGQAVVLSPPTLK